MKLLFLYLSLSGAAVCHAFRPLTTRQTHLKLFEAPPSVNAAPPENEGKDAREEIKDYARNLSFVVSDPNGKRYVVSWILYFRSPNYRNVVEVSNPSILTPNAISRWRWNPSRTFFMYVNGDGAFGLDAVISMRSLYFPVLNG